jgi:hypothetical protein
VKVVRTAKSKPAVGRALVILAALTLGACGGSDEGGSGTTPTPPAPPGPAPNPTPGPGEVLISGTVTYDFVPHRLTNNPPGLDYAQTEPRPARRVTIQFVDGAGVLASAQTDGNGNYALVVAENRSGLVRVLAESVRAGTPGWAFRVLDNTDGNALYALDGAVDSSGTAASRRDLHAGSGWTGSGYGDERAAAPFAILDTVHEIAEFLAAADPALDLPPLSLHWSPDNQPVYGADGSPDPASGEIGTSFYSVNPAIGTNGIYLLGTENEDTEEYDRHVIAHEFAHYLERQLGRSDNIGGPHALGDRLDMRVAFSEGWASAFAALALESPVYRDSGGFRQQGAFFFDAEAAGANAARGWFSEQSILELIYDLVDVTVDGTDGFDYPFADVWQVMTGPIRTTPALTSIFPFYRALKLAHPGDEALLDQLAGAQSIGPVAGAFGDGETNDGGGPDVLPVYTPVAVDGQAAGLCSNDDFSSPVTGSTNKLSSRRYLRFTPPGAGDVTITVRATSIPSGQFADPDFWVHREGPVAFSEGPPSAACEDVGNGAWSPGSCVEAETFFLAAAEHVLEIYEWTNTNAAGDPDYPPIGRTCFEVTVTQP